MERIFTKLDVFVVNMKCPKCKEGIMEMDKGEELMLSGNGKKLHICNVCGHKAVLSQAYPRIEYREAAKEQEKAHGCNGDYCEL